MYLRDAAEQYAAADARQRFTDEEDCNGVDLTKEFDDD